MDKVGDKFDFSCPKCGEPVDDYGVDEENCVIYCYWKCYGCGCITRTKTVDIIYAIDESECD